MSGHKRTTITLSREELRRLQEASRRLSQVDHDFQRIQEQVAHLRNQNADQAYQELEARQQAINHSMQGVNAHLASIEFSTSQAVVSHAASLKEDIARMGTDVWENTHALLNEHANHMENTMVEAQAARQAQYKRLHRSLNQIQRSEQEKAAYAEQAIQDSHLLFAGLSDLYSGERSAAIGLQSADHLINQAQENLGAGFSEAALLAAQQCFDSLSHLRVQVESHIHQREMFHQFALEKFASVQEDLHTNRSVQAVNSQGETLDRMIDVDFWSQGRWRSLNQRLRRIHSLLNGQDAHEIDHSQEAIAALTELENEIPHVVFNARLAVISSQVRFNIAEFVVTALQEQGFALETSTYDQNDMRSGYSIQLGNFEGSHVLVQLTPHPSDPIAHDLDIAFRDQDLRTEHEMRQRAGELAVSLNAYGLQLNDLQTLPNTGKPADNSTRSLTRRVHEVKKHYGNN